LLEEEGFVGGRSVCWRKRRLLEAFIGRRGVYWRRRRELEDEAFTGIE
jgi:hypothetical protein